MKRLLRLLPKILGRVHLEYRIFLWQINKCVRKNLVHTTKQGVFKLPLLVDDPISMTLFIRGNYELDLIRKALSFLRNDQKCPPKGRGAVLDIGANNGVISIEMLVTGEIDKAIAIEPDLDNFKILQCNIELNNLTPKIIALNIAASDSESVLNFELSDSNLGDHRIQRVSPSFSKSEELYNESKRQVIQVEANTIEKILENVEKSFKNDIALVWIDVQGYEGFVFRGAKEFLSSGIPVISEIWPYGIQRAGMSIKEFCEIAQEIWSFYCVQRRGKFIKYPINLLDLLFEELRHYDEYENVIFL